MAATTDAIDCRAPAQHAAAALRNPLAATPVHRSEMPGYGVLTRY